MRLIEGEAVFGSRIGEVGDRKYGMGGERLQLVFMSDLDLVEDREARYGVTERFKQFVLDVWAFCETVPNTPTGRNVVF